MRQKTRHMREGQHARSAPAILLLAAAVVPTGAYAAPNPDILEDLALLVFITAAVIVMIAAVAYIAAEILTFPYYAAKRKEHQAGAPYDLDDAESVKEKDSKGKDGRTAKQLYQSPLRFTVVNRVPTGCRSFDDLLGGGIERGSITLLYGEAGAGKSNVCLQAARNVIRNGEKAAYIDSEGLSYDRVNQIFGADGESAKGLLVSQVHSFEEQSDRVDKTANLADKGIIGLAIVDSINMFYRINHDDVKVRNDFVRQVEALLGMARKNDVAVLLTSQVYSNLATGGIEFLGGHSLSHNSKTILRLDKKGNSVRTAVITKHRSLPEGRSANYKITSTGIEDL